MPVDPVILSAKFRDPRRVKRRFVPQQDINRRVAEAMRAFREDAIDRPQRARDASCGATSAQVRLPARRGQRAHNFSFNFDKIEVKMPVDPAVVAAHEQAQAQDAQQKAEDARVAQLPGIAGVFHRSRRWAGRHAGKFFIALLILVDRLSLGLNLNSLLSSIASMARFGRP